MPENPKPPERKPDLVVEADSFTEFIDHNILATLDPTKPIPPPIIPRITAPDENEESE